MSHAYSSTAVSPKLPLLPLQDLAFGKVFTDHMLLVSVLQQTDMLQSTASQACTCITPLADLENS
jgi:hypothetical protein